MNKTSRAGAHPTRTSRRSLWLSLKSKRERKKWEQTKPTLVSPASKNWPAGWLAFLIDPIAQASAKHGSTLQGFTVTRKRDRWLVTVKIRWNGRSLVGFNSAKALVDALSTTGYLMGQKRLKWKTSKYGG